MSNTRFNADIAFVMEIAWAVAAVAAPFLCNFRTNFALCFASAKPQMQVKQMLYGQLGELLVWNIDILVEK